MRRLILLGLLVLLLAQAVVVLYALGRAGITSETRRLEDDARRARVSALETARDGLAADLEALVSREENRAWYHYRPLYLPPDLVATTLALVPSPLTEQPEDPLVRYYFEYRDGELTSPCLFEGAPATASCAWAEGVRTALPELEPLMVELERSALPGDAAEEVRREVIDQFVCETNAAPDLKLQQLAQTEDAPQAQLKGEWDAYQSRVGKQTGQYNRSQPRRGNQTVEVSISPFLWSRHGRDPTDWPAMVVAVRRVEVGGGRWLQGFALDLRHLRDVHIKAVTHRVRKTAPSREEDERDFATADLASLEGSLPSTASRGGSRPDTTCVLPAGTVPPTFASTRLLAPFDELSLVDKAAPVDPRGLLAGSRTLLDGALALAFGVVVLGGGLLGFAARSERRLAQQRSDFVAALTHELKAPITGFRALTELLHDGLVTDEAKKREYYASMLSESERLSRLVQNVLDASQLERGALRVVPEPLDATPLLEDAASRFRPRLESEGFKVEVDLAPDLPRAIADREAFAHVVGNLLDNAAKYGRGAELSIRLEARVAVDHTGSWLRVSVQDRGPGVSARDRAKIFDRFYRGDAPRQVGGAGLGLTIARALARAMGGDLLLEDAAAPGARFTLRLPLAPAVPA